MAKINWQLYGILDPQHTQHHDPWTALQTALHAGLRLVQWRDKREGLETHERLRDAARCVELVQQHEGICIINDRVDLALAAGAHGVHLGPHDLPVDRVRPWVPKGFMLGASAGTPEDALALKQAGADYLGVGALYQAHPSKPNASKPRGLDVITHVRDAVGEGFPFVGIGGITQERLPDVIKAGANGAAMIRGVFAAKDITAAVHTMLKPL